MFFSFKDTTHSWFVRIVFFLVLIVFAFFGVYSYLDKSVLGGAVVAKVSGRAIEIGQFESGYQSLVNSRPELLQRSNEPRVKRYLLENMINQRLLLAYAQDLGLVASRKELFDKITNDPNFFTDNRFDRRKYEAYLKATGKTASEMEQEITGNYQLALFNDFIDGLTLDSSRDTLDLWRVNNAERKVEWLVFQPERFYGDVSTSSAQEREFFNQNQARYKLSPSYAIDYYILSGEERFLGGSIQPNESELQNYYNNNPQSFVQKAGYHASNILLLARTPEEIQAKQALAAKLIQELKVNPSLFDAYVKKYSEDPFSKSKNGDLGWVSYGDFLPAFEAAVKQMPVGGFEGPVQTEIGLHIIKLLATREEKQLPYNTESVLAEMKRATIASRIAAAAARTDYSDKTFAELALELNKKPAVISDINRENQNLYPFGSALYNALGSVKVGSYGAASDNKELVLYHLTAAKPERLATFDEAKDRVAEDLKRTLAVKKIADLLNKNNQSLQNKDGFDAFLKKYKLTTRTADIKRNFFGTDQTFPAELKADLFAAKPPTNFIVKTVQDQIVGIYITKIIESSEPKPAELASIGNTMQSFFSNYYYGSLINDLRQRYTVRYNTDMMHQLNIELDSNSP